MKSMTFTASSLALRKESPHACGSSSFGQEPPFTVSNEKQTFSIATRGLWHCDRRLLSSTLQQSAIMLYLYFPLDLDTFSKKTSVVRGHGSFTKGLKKMTADQVAATDHETPQHESKLGKESNLGQYSTPPPKVYPQENFNAKQNRSPEQF
jgi:hypothetical protein